MRILIAGGTGFIGSELVSHFEKEHQVIVLGRRKVKKPNYFQWDGNTIDNWKDQLKDLDVVINLTGKSVDCRYTERNKKEILDSRTNSIKVLEKAFLELDESPRVWVQASTATIYQDEYDSPNEEENGIIGKGFSVDVARKWESTFNEVKLNCKKVTLRMTIVMGKSGGAFPILKRMAKLGLGGKQGVGKQMVSWIHIKDLIGIIELAIHNQWVNGVINCVSPNPITNEELMWRIRKRNRIPFGFSAPVWLLNLGARIIGTETELILKSRWVESKKLDKFGYTFNYSTFDKALEAL